MEKDQTLRRLFIVFFLGFALFTSYVFLSKPLTKLTRASEELKPSIQNSLVFAWPLKTTIGKQSVITVFARNYQGRGIVGKQVELSTTLGSIQHASATSDSQGMVKFVLSSSTPGVAEIKVMVDNIGIQRTISVQFE